MVSWRFNRACSCTCSSALPSTRVKLYRRNHFTAMVGRIYNRPSYADHKNRFATMASRSLKNTIQRAD